MLQNHQRKRVDILRNLHKAVCEEQGEHPDEVDTAFSEGADAIERLAAIDEKDRSKQIERACLEAEATRIVNES